jgi:hypothetical protein
MLICLEKEKLLMAFFALMMVIKLIKVKLMFLLPVLLGVGTAKKLFLKMLLFIFPAFAQIFKFCAYYHAAHTKFHHHHHQVSWIRRFNFYSNLNFLMKGCCRLNVEPTGPHHWALWAY